MLGNGSRGSVSPQERKGGDLSHCPGRGRDPTPGQAESISSQVGVSGGDVSTHGGKEGTLSIPRGEGKRRE